jgi:hypothetical protein
MKNNNCIVEYRCKSQNVYYGTGISCTIDSLNKVTYLIVQHENYIFLDLQYTPFHMKTSYLIQRLFICFMEMVKIVKNYVW